MKNTLFKKVFVIPFILIAIIFTVVPLTLEASNETMIDSYLLKQFDDLVDDQTIDVYVWKKSINHLDYIAELNNLGFDEEIYSNEDQFQNEIVSKLDFYDKNNQIIRLRQEYKIARRKAIKNITEKYNSSFLNDYNIPKNDVIYSSSYTSTQIISINKEKLYKILYDERIIEITEYKQVIFTPDLSISINQIDAGYGTSSNPGLKNLILGGYDGTNVKIGIIEALKGKFDSNSPQLASMVNSGQLTYVDVLNVTPTISSHATHVTNILAGQSYTYSGVKYEGVATGAKIYQSGILLATDAFVAINQFITLGVDVINCSYGSPSTSYTFIDREIDNLSYTSKVIIVCSAGNTSGDVNTPSRAYNSITVGNVDTIDELQGNFYPESIPYYMYSSSSYSVMNYHSNKPEVSAPGANICSVFSNGVYTSSGTSMSAPLVSGIVAQLIQKYMSSVNTNNYLTYFKTRLMLGASTSNVFDSSHRIGDSSIFFNKQGSGLVNAVESSSSISGWNKYVAIDDLLTNYYVHILTPPFNYKIKVVLVFEKPENIIINSAYMNNFDLYLESPNGITHKSSTSSVNVHEILKYTIPAFQDTNIRVHKYSSINSQQYISISCFWMGV